MSSNSKKMLRKQAACDQGDRGENRVPRPRDVVMVGGFPPPITGMIAVNQAVRHELESTGASVLALDIAAKSLSRSLRIRLNRLRSVFRGIVRLLTTAEGHEATIYIAVSGGLGKIYETIFVAAARYRRMRIYLHHHSYAYLDQASLVTRVLTYMAGTGSTHITLSDLMAQRLLTRYPSVRRVVAISNTAFLVGKEAIDLVPHRKLRTIGFLSNISVEKGILDFLLLVERCEEEGVALKARIAGPFQSEEVEKEMLGRVAACSSVEYVGAQYGAGKEQFLESIDALVFPTKYVNEAEPLTIHEAMQRAIPVIAYGRGSIPEVLRPTCGLVIDPAEPFVPTALEFLKGWLKSPEDYEAASKSAAACFRETHIGSQMTWSILKREMLGLDAYPSESSLLRDA